MEQLSALAAFKMRRRRRRYTHFSGFRADILICSYFWKYCYFAFVWRVSPKIRKYEPNPKSVRVQRGPFVFVSFCADPASPPPHSRPEIPTGPSRSGIHGLEDLATWLLRFTNTSPPPGTYSYGSRKKYCRLLISLFSSRSVVWRPVINLLDEKRNNAARPIPLLLWAT